jgi:hypothetical protein
VAFLHRENLAYWTKRAGGLRTGWPSISRDPDRLTEPDHVVEEGCRRPMEHR